MATTHPNSKSKIIVGYIGASVGATDLFRFRKPGENEYFEGKILDRNYSISKEKACAGWRKVKITIDIIAE